MQLLHTFLILILLLSSLFVFLAENPVHSVLFLIFTFFNSSIILFLFNAEFLGLVFIIIYVGAIAVLFLFVVMMLNVKIVSFNVSSYIPVLFLCLFIIFFQIYFAIEKSFSNFDFISNDFTTSLDCLTNIDVIGQSLYNYYILSFLIAGIILLVSMIGAISLTLNFSSARKKELSSRQLSRSDTFLAFFK